MVFAVVAWVCQLCVASLHLSLSKETFMKCFALAIFLFTFIAVSGCTPNVQPTPPDIQLDDGEFFPEPGNPKCEPGNNCCSTEFAGRIST